MVMMTASLGDDHGIVVVDGPDSSAAQIYARCATGEALNERKGLC